MARTFRNLFATVTSFDNLFHAARAAARGKRGQVEVAAFDVDLERHLFDLQAELRSGTYRPGSYRSFLIFDPKRRLVSAAPFRDRVVQLAVRDSGGAREASPTRPGSSRRTGGRSNTEPPQRSECLPGMAGGLFRWRR